MEEKEQAFWNQITAPPKRRPDRYLYSVGEYEFKDEDTVEVTATTGTVNRLSERMRSSACRLDNYVKNPVVLWMHEWGKLPIGKTVNMEIVEDAMHHLIVFSPLEEAQQIKTLYKRGFLNAWSYGFIIYDYKRVKEGGKDIRELTDTEILELSGVTIPADVGALTVVASLNSFGQGTIIPVEIRKVIPYSKTPLADEDADWDAGEEVAKAEVDDLLKMCAWYDAEYPNIKTSYKLPHHKAGDPYVCVWRGVAAAGAVLMGARGGVDIPESDEPGVKKHLEGHYHDFDRTAPWEEQASLPEWRISVQRIVHLAAELRKAREIAEPTVAPMLYEVVERSLEIMANVEDERKTEAVKFILRSIGQPYDGDMWRDFVATFAADLHVISDDDPRIEAAIRGIERSMELLKKHRA